jgi:hypothetical protein
VNKGKYEWISGAGKTKVETTGGIGMLTSPEASFKSRPFEQFGGQLESTLKLLPGEEARELNAVVFVAEM